MYHFNYTQLRRCRKFMFKNRDIKKWKIYLYGKVFFLFILKLFKFYINIIIVLNINIYNYFRKFINHLLRNFYLAINN